MPRPFKVQPLQQWSVRREYLRRLKLAFDERGIEIPFPHLTVYAGIDKSGNAPALPLRVLGTDAGNFSSGPRRPDTRAAPPAAPAAGAP